MRTCEEPRPPNGPSPIAITAGQRWALRSLFVNVEGCEDYPACFSCLSLSSAALCNWVNPLNKALAVTHSFETEWIKIHQKLSPPPFHSQLADNKLIKNWIVARQAYGDHGEHADVSFYSEYGFAEKVVEGMSVRINSITIKVQARAFHASFELWQLQGNSLNPKWQRSDLRYTRVTDPKRGEVQLRTTAPGWIQPWCA